MLLYKEDSIQILGPRKHHTHHSVHITSFFIGWLP